MISFIFPYRPKHAIPDDFVTIYTTCIYMAAYTPRIPIWGDARVSAAVFLIPALASRYRVYGNEVLQV